MKIDSSLLVREQSKLPRHWDVARPELAVSSIISGTLHLDVEHPSLPTMACSVRRVPGLRDIKSVEDNNGIPPLEGESPQTLGGLPRSDPSAPRHTKLVV